MSECPKCDGTGEAPYEKCCNGLDCACHGQMQPTGDCLYCKGTGEIEHKKPFNCLCED